MAGVDKQPGNVDGPAVAFDDVISRRKIGPDVAHDLHPYQHDSVIMLLSCPVRPFHSAIDQYHSVLTYIPAVKYPLKKQAD